VAIGVVCLIYALMAIEYMGQFFAAHALELYLRSLSAVVSLNSHSQVGSLVHYQTPTYITSRWIMVVHGFALDSRFSSECCSSRSVCAEIGRLFTASPAG
jgi:hypothetical protein